MSLEISWGLVMKCALIIPFALMALFMGGCNSKPQGLVAENTTVQYPSNDGKTYVLILVQEEGMSKEELRDEARRLACDASCKQGCCPKCTIVDEGYVNVSGVDQQKPSEPSNLYYEKIQNNDFTKNSVEDRNAGPPSESNGYFVRVKLCND